MIIQEHRSGYSHIYQLHFLPLPPSSQLVWVASLISTLIFNLDLGLAVAVAFSLLTLIYRTQQSVHFILWTPYEAFYTKESQFHSV